MTTLLPLEQSHIHGAMDYAYLQKAIQRLTQRTVKFIRWLNQALLDPGPSPSRQDLCHLMRPMFDTVV
ncbi:MAG: hypothetical protein RLZZ245_1829 [Verrucomicrobiota bacterium]|jgi:hypothetical protein